MATAEQKRKYYEDQKEFIRNYKVEGSYANRDISQAFSALGNTRNLELYTQAKTDFKLFCESYFPLTFSIPWSPDHIRVIKKIEQAVLHGGSFAVAMPRGSGKTSLCERACIWAMLYGHRAFVAFIGSDEASTLESLEAVKSEIAQNDNLLQDFFEVCVPIRALKGINAKAAGQHIGGESTKIKWIGKEITLPYIQENDNFPYFITVASSATVRCAGITGRVRGMKYQRPDGRSARPDLVIIDDPQTDESAKSLSQNNYRERVLKGAVLGLAGPKQKIAAILPTTVIYSGDMADRILDQKRNPKWNGERTQLLNTFPKNMELWDNYRDKMADSLRAHGDISEATAFYQKNKKKMDQGGAAAWEERYNEDEISAIQHAMNKFYDDEVSFWAESQNQPLAEILGEDDPLTKDDIINKCNGFAKGQFPVQVDKLTAFIDSHKKALYWIILATEPNFTGYVIDYGVYPDQKRRYFTLSDLRNSLASRYRGGLDSSLFRGLETITEKLLGVKYERDDGALLNISQCLIDANWGEATDIVYKFCRQSKYSSVIYPSHGLGIRASSKPFNEKKKEKGERIGHNWRIPTIKGKRVVRHVLFDTNYWKTFVHQRIGVPMGDVGCWSLFGRKPYEHELIADHLTAEYSVATEGRGRTVKEWLIRPERNDNHWFDCLVGAAVAASMQGIILPSQEFKKRAKRVKISLADRQKGRQASYVQGSVRQAKVKRVSLSEMQRKRQEL